MPFFGGAGQYKIIGTNIDGGNDSLAVNIGQNNIAIGNEVLQNNTTGGQNIGVGSRALNDNISGENNVAIGVDSLPLANSSSNIAIGSNALENLSPLSTGSNIAIGRNSGSETTLSNNNVGVGVLSLGSQVADSTGSRNVAVGNEAMSSLDDGSNNVAIGHGAGAVFFDGNNNVALGYQAAANTTGSNNIVIGSQITTSAPAASNEIVIGSGAHNSIMIGGLDFSGGAGSGIVESVVAGANVNVDSSDPANPIVSADGVVTTVVAGTNITVDSTDPNNPVISASGGGGGVTDFTQLSDVPASYSGAAGDYVVVNVSETGLEFVPAPPAGATEFTQLSDVPASYSGSAGEMVIVNAGETGLEFAPIPSGSSAVGFAARKSSVVDTGGSDMTGFTELYDTGSCFNPTTGVFQPATAGIYQINVTANFSAGVNVALNQQEVQIYDSVIGIIYSLTVRAVKDANGTAPNLSGSIYADMDGSNSVTISYTSANANMIISTIYFSATRVG